MRAGQEDCLTMVQRKTTPITRDGSRETTINGGKGKGAGGSSLARASALSQNSSSRQQSQGKGGSNQTTKITGPTDNINRGGRKGVDTGVAQEKKTADGRGKNKINQGTPQESYKDVLTQLKEHAAQRAQTNLSGGGGIKSGGGESNRHLFSPKDMSRADTLKLKIWDRTRKVASQQRKVQTKEDQDRAHHQRKPNPANITRKRSEIAKKRGN